MSNSIHRTPLQKQLYYQLIMTGKCCEIEGKGLYKVGDIVEISEPNSCSRKTVKCGMMSIDLTGIHVAIPRADPP